MKPFRFYFKLSYLAIASLMMGSPLYFDAAFSAERLVIAGTGDNQELLRKLALMFEKRHPQIKVEIPDSIGSGGGIEALKMGKVKLARTARPLKHHEKVGLNAFLFAYSPIVFAVHESVESVTNLSRSQILDIYSGKIRNWRFVGGPDHKIYAVDRESGDSSRTVLEKKIEGFRSIVSVAKIFYTTPEAVAAVADHQYTVGFFPKAAVLSAHLKILSIDGASPSNEEAIQNRYPLLVPFYLVSSGKPAGKEKLFIEYLYSSAAREMMNRNGVIAVTETKEN